MLRRFNKRVSTQLINPLYQVKHTPAPLIRLPNAVAPSHMLLTLFAEALRLLSILEGILHAQHFVNTIKSSISIYSRPFGC